MSPVQANTAISGVNDPAGPRVRSVSTSDNKSFADALHDHVSMRDDVKISAHARKRLVERNIEFGDREHERLSEAVSRIERKGADKSLVLMDNLAVLVSAKNRTVITAFDSASAKGGVFTNIDSAVII